VGGVDRPRRARVAAETIADRGFEWQQTKRKMHSEKLSALFSRSANDYKT